MDLYALVELERLANSNTPIARWVNSPLRIDIQKGIRGGYNLWLISLLCSLASVFLSGVQTSMKYHDSQDSNRLD